MVSMYLPRLPIFFMGLSLLVHSSDPIGVLPHWPYYIQTKPGAGQFVCAPYKYSPWIAHRHNMRCAGHEQQPLYEECQQLMIQLYAKTEEAKTREDYRMVMQLTCCRHVLEAFQDATCSCMQSLEQQLDAWATIIKTFPMIDSALREHMSLNKIYEHVIEAYDSASAEIIKYAKMGNELACATVAADAQLNTRLQKILYEKGTPEQKKNACAYFVDKARQGDLEACCYCAHAKLLVPEKEQELPNVLCLLGQIVATEQGRNILPLFVRLCEEKTIQFLISKKKDKSACAILGLIYNVRKDFVRAFPLLSSCTENGQRFPYLYYSLACLFKNGLGTKVDFGNAIGLFVKSIGAGADKDLLHEIEKRLEEIAGTHNVAAACELLLLRIGAHGNDYSYVESFWHEVNGKQEPYADYMLKKDFPRRLQEDALHNNVAAHALLASLHLRKAEVADVHKSIAELEAALACLMCIPLEINGVRHDLGKIALMLSTQYRKIGNLECSMKYAQKAVDYKMEGADRKLALLRMAGSDVTPEMMQEGIAAALQDADAGDNDALRASAKICVFGCKSKNGVSCKRQPAEGYKLVKKLLERVPNDPEGLYMLGVLLYKHGGTDGIPANEDLAQICLIKALEKEPIPDGSIFIHVACTYFKKKEYEKAFQWIAKESSKESLPRQKLYEGIFYMAAPVPYADYEKALNCFEQFLKNVRPAPASNFIQSLMCEQDNFITRIKGKAATDDRFLLVLLRFAQIYGLELVGMSKENVLEYLDAMLQRHVPAAVSFNARLYVEGVLREQSYEKALLWAKQVIESSEAGLAMEEAALVLTDIAELESQPIAIKAQYELCKYYLNSAKGKSKEAAVAAKRAAVSQFRDIEGKLASFFENRELREYACSTGLWSRMLQEAQSDNVIAGNMGVLYLNRLSLYDGLAWIDETETVGIPLLKKGLGSVPTINAEAISNAYIMLARKVAAANEGQERCKLLLVRAAQANSGVVIADQQLIDYCGLTDSISDLASTLPQDSLEKVGMCESKDKGAVGSILAQAVLDTVPVAEDGKEEKKVGKKKNDKQLAACKDIFELKLREYAGKSDYEQNAIEKDLCDMALRMASLAQEDGDMRFAKKCIEYACNFESQEAKKQYIECIRGCPQATPDECKRALHYLEDSATWQRNVDAQRLLAQIYSQRIQFFGKKYEIKADAEKAHNYVDMLLYACPDDVEGRFIKGFLLVEDEALRLQSAYNTIVTLLKEPSANNIELVRILIEAAERALIKGSAQNKILATSIHTAEALAALDHRAVNDPTFAALLGVVICRRYTHGIADWTTLRAVGIPSIERALKGNRNLFVLPDLATAYVKCAKRAVQLKEQDIQGICDMCARALEFDPHNKEALMLITSLPFMHTLTTEQYAQCLVKNLSGLEELAKKGDDAVALHLGGILLQISSKEGNVAKYKAGINYLRDAALKGNQCAICAIIGAFLRESGLRSQYAGTAALDCLTALMHTKDVTDVDLLCYNGFKSLAQRQLKQALGYFEQFVQKAKSPDMLIKVACSLSNIVEGYVVSCKMLERAVEIAGNKKMVFDGSDMKNMLQKMVPSFEKKVGSVPEIGGRVSRIKSVLARYSFVL